MPVTPRTHWLRRTLPGPWFLVALAIALPAILAIGVVAGASFSPDTEVWPHLLEFVLPRVLSNTFWLVLGVAIITTILGTGLAWLTAVCEFPGRGIFAWALLLPLAIPGYVLGFVAIGLLEYAGPVQGFLREWLGPGGWLPPIRSRAGIIVVLSLTLYPYVYLVARSAFLTQGKRVLEVAQSVGFNSVQGFFKVALPMARPWIAGGVMLVVMETLADFGTVAVFNYDTLTTAIYHAWFGLFSVKAALQLASFLVLGVFIVVALEQWLRTRARYHPGKSPPGDRIRLGVRNRWLGFACCGLVLLLAFILPFTQLLIWAWRDVVGGGLDLRFWGFAWRSVSLSLTAAGTITVAALLLNYAMRLDPHPLSHLAGRIATLGYAMPGTVLAIGIFVPLAFVNNQLQAMLDFLFAANAPQLALQTGLATMLLAYLVRFLAVAHQPVAANMLRITPAIDESVRVLGVSGWAALRRVHFPMLRTGLLTAFALAFVDLMKEMPITLMTRPFGWETLAVRVFEMTSEGQWQQAALPACAIVLVGLLPVVILTRRSEHEA
ncbi:MAG: iron ABC transporter permease [Proteobacteria bacterium]|nr:iron ABC transporter permease [Pseudomonadota bacterium]MCH7892996.1 iron ABC transporter permease [Pseudomonadota bacterium]